MKIGDMVRYNGLEVSIGPEEKSWVGIIVDFEKGGTCVIVFWNKDFPDEREYTSQLEVISEKA